MFVVISGTNRRGSATARVAALCAKHLESLGESVQILDLIDLPSEALSPDAYFNHPPELAPFQAAVDAAQGVVTVVPEYNGSFPGVLKLWIDMLEFPRTLRDVPSCFVGLAAGRWGGLRSVEQLEQVFNYRNALIYSERTFLPAIHDALNEEGQLTDTGVRGRLEAQLAGFAEFAKRNPRTTPEVS